MNKYRNKPVKVDGIRFDSQAEARRYGQLKLLERAGKIRGLEVHPRFDLFAGGQIIGHYVADFKYIGEGSVVVVEDVKGVQTDLFKWKRKHFEAEYGIPITIIK